MKVEKIGNKEYYIFFNILYLGIIHFTKEKIIDVVTKLLKKLRKRLLLHGFYKVKVYLHSKIGLFLEVIQLEEFEYDDSLDFRVIVYFDEKIYFRTKDFFSLPKSGHIYFDDGYFYCDVNAISNLLSVVEFGDFVYGKRLYPVMFRWHEIKL